MNFVSIPHSFLKDKKLNGLQKILYCFIYGFKKFYMKDDSLAGYFDLPITTLQNNLRNMESVRYIKRFTTPIKQGGKQRIIKCLVIIPDYPKSKESTNQNSTLHYPKVETPNKDIRITNNNRDNIISPELVSRMKSKYPEDFTFINQKFYDFYIPKGYAITDAKYEKWFQNESSNHTNETTGTDHSDIILKAVHKFGSYKPNEAKDYCRENGDDDTMVIIKNAGWGELCKMNESQFTNQVLLRYLTTNTLPKNGHSGRTSQVQSVGDIISNHQKQ